MTFSTILILMRYLPVYQCYYVMACAQKARARKTKQHLLCRNLLVKNSKRSKKPKKANWKRSWTHNCKHRCTWILITPVKTVSDSIIDPGCVNAPSIITSPLVGISTSSAIVNKLRQSTYGRIIGTSHKLIAIPRFALIWSLTMKLTTFSFISVVLTFKFAFKENRFSIPISDLRMVLRMTRKM